jgi:hypothetical protein
MHINQHIPISVNSRFSPSRAFANCIFIAEKRVVRHHSCHRRHLRTSMSRAWSRMGFVRSWIMHHWEIVCSYRSDTWHRPCSWHIFGDNAAIVKFIASQNEREREREREQEREKERRRMYNLLTQRFYLSSSFIFSSVSQACLMHQSCITQFRGRYQKVGK